MTGRDVRSFADEVQRFRPLATVVVAVVLTAPSLLELTAGNLSAVSLLARLALALPVGAALVWVVSAVVLRYARVQARARAEGGHYLRNPDEFDR
jgi:hypothetical protein